MKEKHGPHQAEVVGKEGLCSQRGWDQSTGPSSQEETSREGGQRGGSRLPSPPLSLQDWQVQAPREEGGWEGPGVSGTPPPSSREETDSPAVSALLWGLGRFVQNKGGRGRIPAWRMKPPHFHKQREAVDS